MLFYLDNLQIIGKCVSLHCVFHSIRFKVNKGWSKALLLFLCPYLNNKNSGPENKSFQARNFYFMLLSFTSVQS